MNNTTPARSSSRVLALIRHCAKDRASLRTVLLAGISLASGASAQPGARSLLEAVVPAAGLGDRRGSATFWLPCGFPPRFNQYLFKVPEAVPLLTRSLAFRRHDDIQTPPTYPAFTVDLEIAMAHSPRHPEGPSYDLAANRGPDFTWVLPRQTIAFAATQQRSDGGYPFDYRIPLARPFAFAPGATGLIEFRVYATSACKSGQNNLRFEWYSLHRPLGQSIGTSCDGIGLFPSSLMAGHFGWAIQFPPQNAGSAVDAHAHVFGGLRSDTWAGLQLPHGLDHLGAPGCSLYISFDWEWPSYWDTALRAIKYADLSLPNDPRLVGRTIYLQGVLFDRLANPLGFATTRAWAMTVGPHLDVPLSTVTAPWGPNRFNGGQVEVGGGPVFQLSDR